MFFLSTVTTIAFLMDGDSLLHDLEASNINQSTTPKSPSKNNDKGISIGDIERINLLGTSWSKSPGVWWDTDWEYRVQVNVTSDRDLVDWPIEIRINFNPPAHRYSVRVINGSGKEIPSQLSDVSYVPGDVEHIASANITFLVTQRAGTTYSYWVYWRTDYVDPPTYEKRFRIDLIHSGSQTVYRITSLVTGSEWSIDLPASNGGKAVNLIHMSGDNLTEKGVNHFGLTVNGSTAYNDYWGTANTSVSYSSRAIPGYDDSFIRAYHLGVIFVPYKIINATLIDSGNNTIGYANYTYKIYTHGVRVVEEIKFVSGFYVRNIYTQGWVFDQDDGPNDYNFDKIYTPTGTVDISIPRYSTISDSVTRPWSGPSSSLVKYLYRTDNGLPGLGIVRVWLSAGNHTVTVTPLNVNPTSLSADDWATRIADPDGNWVQFTGITEAGNSNTDYYGLGDNNYLVYSYGPWFTASFNAPVDGYYYIVIDNFDDDGNDNLATYGQFSIDVDGNYLASISVATFWSNRIAWGRHDPTDDSFVFPRDSVRLINLEVDSEAVNSPFRVVLDWVADTDNLDIIVLDPYSNVMGYNISNTGSNATVTFTPIDAGNYTIVVHKFSGSAPTNFNINIEVLAGPEYEDAYVHGGFNNFAIYHSARPLGIGFVKVEESFSGISPSAKEYTIYNKGYESEDDYIFVARNITINSNIPPNSYINEEYYLIIWKPTGTTDAEKISQFQSYVNMIGANITMVEGSIEKFHLDLTIRVKDKNGVGIPNATVELFNGSTLAYSAKTGVNGSVELEIVRWNYTLDVTVHSLNTTYKISTWANYSRTNYDTHNQILDVTFSSLVKFTLFARSNTTTPFPIQNGTVELVANSSFKLIGYTNLTGWLVAFIEEREWTLYFDKSDVPAGWDYFYLYNDTFTTVIGSPPYTSITINLASDASYLLVDANITSPKFDTILQLYNTPGSFSVSWKDIINVSLYMAERSNTSKYVSGRVDWYVIDPQNNIRLNGSVTSTSGFFTFTVDTSNLDAGITYSIKVEGKPSNTTKYLNPVPIIMPLTVNPRLTSLTVSFTPSQTIVWGESLTIEAYYVDVVSNTGISTGSVNITLSKGDFSFIASMGWDGAKFTYTFPSFNFDSGIYTLRVVAGAKNYINQEYISQVFVSEIPTVVSYPAQITIPWQSTYTVYFAYLDARDNSPIGGANVRVEISNSSGVIDTPTANFDGDEYYFVIDMESRGISEGDYIITIGISKSNYKGANITIPLTINLRKTVAQTDLNRVDAIYGENVSVRVSFYDVEEATPSPIPSGSGEYAVYPIGEEVSVKNGSLIGFSNGTYLLAFSTSDVGLGSFYITISLRANHYQSQIILVYLNVYEIPTIAIPDKTSDIKEWGENITIIVNYNRSDTNTGIEGADTKTFAIKQGDSTVLTGELKDLGSGTYLLQINTTELGVGTFTIEISLGEPYYQSRNIVIAVSINEVSTYAFSDYSNITLIWSEEISFNVYYRISRTDEGVRDANISIALRDIDNNLIDELNATEIAAGTYEVNIRTINYNYGTYYLSIILSKDNYTSQSLLITLKIEAVPTVGLLNVTDITLYWGESVKINFTYFRTDTSTGISGAAVRYHIEDITANLTYPEVGDETDASGSLVIEFNSTDFEPGHVYILYINATKPNYSSALLEVKIKVLLRPLTVTLSSNYLDVVWGDVVNITLTINDTLTGEGVEATLDIQPNPDGIISYTMVSPGIYVLTIDSTKTNTTYKDYPITISIYKDNYVSKQVGLSLTLRQIVLESRIYGSDNVQLNPITGGSSNFRVSIFDATRNNRPVTDAKVYMTLSVGDKNATFEMEKIETEPGYYTLTIDWQKLPIFVPGTTYNIIIKVEGLNVNGKIAPASMVVLDVIEGESVTSVTVDYIGGSSNVPGIGYVPNAIFYPSLIAVIAIASVVAYRVISYIRLPVEVRVIDKLIKAIEKGVLEYETPSREEVVSEIIREELSP